MHRLEGDLRQALHGVTAPPHLWDRIQAAQVRKPARRNRPFVWATAAAVALIAVALSTVHRQTIMGDEAFALRALSSDSQRIAFHCQNPAQLRAWVRANTGLDLPLQEPLSPSVQLVGAQTIGNGTGGVEVAYRAGNRDAILLVSKADADSATVPHRRASGNTSSWVMSGQRFTLASNDPADLQLACKLCHLD
jgi:hypothetical protein